jgi:hypothetical protein
MSCYEPSKATLEKLAKRQANKGIAPCGECNLNRHNCCRPRMDGTLCTCSCARAEAMRQRAATDHAFLKGYLEAQRLSLRFKWEA